MRILIKAGDVSLKAELRDTPAASALYEALPIEAPNNVWGDEFYFEVPFEMELDESATRKVKVGDIGYWPPGSAVAIFFGPTPMSYGPDPVPASEVSVIGRVEGDATALKKAKAVPVIVIEKV